MERFISNFKKKESEIKLNMLTGGGGSYGLGSLSTNDYSIAWEKNLYEDIEQDIAKCIEHEGKKTGCLLYGDPGTGKTRFVKYIAQKYALPIYMVQLDAKSTNTEVLQMFNAIPKRCIVLFEDFDSMFDKRKCLFQSDQISFTFDSILNGLDGVFNNYKQVVFIMTANDIDKIDDAIKLRSSRFKFVRKITHPTYDKRFEILDDEDIARITEGFSLDKLFFLKSLKDSMPKENIIKKIENGIYD
jgi:SpoVK/Ycf46/Vps4 family AAA+-type ATPase